MKLQESCICCGSEEDPYLDFLSVVHRPPDAFVGLILGALISAGSTALVYSLAPPADYLPSIIAFIGVAGGVTYYTLRTKSASIQILVCLPCRKKYAKRRLLRVVIITAMVLISVVGAVVVSAVMGRDDYTYVPAVLAGIIGIIALCFRRLSKPRFVVIGDKQSVITIPGIGPVQVDNSWILS